MVLLSIERFGMKKIICLLLISNLFLACNSDEIQSFRKQLNENQSNLLMVFTFGEDDLVLCGNLNEYQSIDADERIYIAYFQKKELKSIVELLPLSNNIPMHFGTDKLLLACGKDLILFDVSERELKKIEIGSTVGLVYYLNDAIHLEAGMGYGRKYTSDDFELMEEYEFEPYRLPEVFDSYDDVYFDVGEDLPKNFELVKKYEELLGIKFYDTSLLK